MENQQSTQGILSIIALVCLAAGWFNLFSPEINTLLSRKVFYILIGTSFFIQAPLMRNKNLMYVMYLAAVVCVLGGLIIPIGSRWESVKTAGLLAGIILSIANRPGYRQ